MPRTCTICNHAQRDAIDLSLLEGQPLRNIAERFTVSATALHRHKDHLPGTLIKAQEKAEALQTLDVLKQLRAINGASLNILKEARDKKDGNLALKAVDRIQRQIELQAKLLGELQNGPVVNISVSPEWLSLRIAITSALQPYPEAAQAVARALDDVS